MAALACALAGCDAQGAAQAPAAPAAELRVAARRGVIEAPDSIAAGWRRIRVEETDGGHIIVVFRLLESATDAGLPGFLADLDTAAGTPPSALALGGPEVGDSGEVVIELTAGHYLLGCVARDEAGHRHAGSGEARLLVVTEGPAPAAEARAAAPAATLELGMADFAYTGAEDWNPGPQMLRVANTGAQDHQVQIARLEPGSTVTDWMNAEKPRRHARAVAGVARMGPGTVTYLPLDLTTGEYVIYCLITDPASRQQHVAMGMFRGIRVR